jgi:phosphate starvation-inducible PhoH-like protein
MAKRQEVVKKIEVIKSPKDILDEILPTRYRLKCKNQVQKEFATLINDHEIVIASGPAGVGKSYVAVARALELLQNRTSPYSQIIISTPAEEAGENLGYLPGNLREKMEPYLASTFDVFDKIIGKKKRIELEEAEILLIQPLGFIRGKSIDNTILIMEEAQNMTPMQMKTLLTRIGDNSKFIISGDLDQSDRFKNPKHTGLYDAIQRHKNVSTIGFMEFGDDEENFVRNPIIKKILDNYKVDITIEEVNASKRGNNKTVRVEPRVIKHSKLGLITRIKLWFRKNFKR